MFNPERYVHPNQFSLLNKYLLQPCASNLVYTLTLEMINGCYVKTLQEPSIHLFALCLFEFIGIF
jgi:hypothetical protein